MAAGQEQVSRLWTCQSFKDGASQMDHQRAHQQALQEEQAKLRKELQDLPHHIRVSHIGL